MLAVNSAFHPLLSSSSARSLCEALSKAALMASELSTSAAARRFRRHHLHRRVALAAALCKAVTMASELSMASEHESSWCSGYLGTGSSSNVTCGSPLPASIATSASASAVARDASSSSANANFIEDPSPLRRYLQVGLHTRL